MISGNGTLSQRKLNNNGSTTLTGAFTVSNNGVINNAAGHVFAFQDNGSAFNGNVSTFNNAGTLTKTGTAGSTGTLNVALNNTGTVDAQSGTLRLAGGGLMDGGTYTSSGGTLNFYDGVHTVTTSTTITGTGVQLSTATLTGAGDIRVVSGALLAFTALADGTRFSGSSGTARPPLVLPVLGALEPWQFVFVLAGAPGLLVAALLFTIREPLRRERLARTQSETSVGHCLAYLRRNRAAYAPLMIGMVTSLISRS